LKGKGQAHIFGAHVIVYGSDATADRAFQLADGVRQVFAHAHAHDESGSYVNGLKR